MSDDLTFWWTHTTDINGADAIFRIPRKTECFQKDLEAYMDFLIVQNEQIRRENIGLRATLFDRKEELCTTKKKE